MITRIFHRFAVWTCLCRRNLNFFDIFGIGEAATAGDCGLINKVLNFYYACGTPRSERSVCYISAGASSGSQINNFSSQNLTWFGSLSLHLRVMGKAKGGFYAVAKGRKVGIFHTWPECEDQVKGFSNPKYKKFASVGEAEAFIEEHREPGAYKMVPPSKPTTASIPEQPPTISSYVNRGVNLILHARPGPCSFSDLPGTSTTATASTRNVRSGSSGLTRTIFLPEPHLIIPNPAHKSQKRSLSKTAYNVAEDRVVNKRSKLTKANSDCLDLAKFTVDEDGFVVVFTDGACSKNGKVAAKAGIGVWFGHDHYLNISEPVSGRQTNNTAEIQAAERAIRQAKENGINKLKIKTDSKFSINCVTKWLYNWKRNNWRLSAGGDVKNKEDLIKLDEAMQNMEIKWSYVAGHAGIEGNEAADRLAVAGAERS